METTPHVYDVAACEKCKSVLYRRHSDGIHEITNDNRCHECNCPVNEIPSTGPLPEIETLIHMFDFRFGKGSYCSDFIMIKNQVQALGQYMFEYEQFFGKNAFWEVILNEKDFEPLPRARPAALEEREKKLLPNFHDEQTKPENQSLIDQKPVNEEFDTAPCFFCTDEQKLHQNILEAPLKIPSELFSPDCEDLVRRLLQRNPQERLGASTGFDEIREHRWFAEVDWDEVYNKMCYVPVYADKKLK